MKALGAAIRTRCTRFHRGRFPGFSTIHLLGAWEIPDLRVIAVVSDGRGGTESSRAKTRLDNEKGFIE